jgi:hypothetical protein
MSTKNTLQLWTQLSKIGKFSDSYYDENIYTDLKQALVITGNFEEGLREIPAEQFLQTFFRIISPLTSMYIDILNLYERCNAKTSNENIEIEIDISKLKHVKFNAAHFTHAKESITRIKRSTQHVDLSPDGVKLLWSLPHHSRKNVPTTNESFMKWYELYYDLGVISPSTSLDFKSIISDSPIKAQLYAVYLFWLELAAYYKSFQATYDKSFHTPRGIWLKKYDELDKNSEKYNHDILRQETDYILGSTLGRLYYIAENYKFFSPDEQEETRNILTEFNKFIKISDDYVETIICELKNFFSLPVWKHRHELYSVWVFVKMIEKIPDKYISFNVQDNALVFSYSGELLASTIINDIQLDIWTELRTNAIMPLIGKGRKKAIQPDYSIVCGCPSNAENSIIVIECKQYKQPNITNFKQAITDYAKNRPKAKVLLTDYGNFDPQKLITQTTISNERYQVFTMCRPELESSTQLSSTVWKLICQYAGIYFTLEDTANFTLHWGKNPQDLDLHLLFKPEQAIEMHQSCSYCNSMEGTTYSGDVRNGCGPEEISIHKWQKGIYELWVNNYSQTPLLAQSNATVTILFTGTKKRTFTIECPKEGDSQWWHLLSINTHNCTIEIINELKTFTHN